MSDLVELRANQLFKALSQVPLAIWQKLVALALLVWLCFSLAQLSWVLYAFAQSPELAAPLTVAPNAALAERGSSVQSAVDIERLKALDIFGKADEAVAQVKEEPVVSAVEQNAPDTSLKLLLKGIVASEDPKSTRAIIADGDKQDIYAIGDTLPAGRGVTLARVMDDKVILQNNGRYESLWLYSEENAAANAAKNRPQTRTVARNRSSSSAASKTAKSLASGEASLADVIKVSMVREAGRVVGYRVRPGRNKELFDSLGLKPNDVVTSVNGVNLDSSSKAMEVYKSMRSETSATFDVKRGDETLSLNIDTN